MERFTHNDALALFLAGVEAADPHKAVKRGIKDLPRSPSHVVAIGKAASAMVRAAISAYPGCPALVVTNPENAAQIEGAHVVCGDHPVPSANSLSAGQAVLDFLSPLGAQDHVLALISGGGSALMVAPLDGVSLADKIAVNEVLLGAGLDIVSMNTVRQALSQVKGGGLLRAASPALVTSLVLSDVVGDDPRAVASGPTVAPLGDAQSARDILRPVWDQLPIAVQNALTTPQADDALPDTQIALIGSNGISVQAMSKEAPEARVDPIPLEGDVSEAAARIVAQAQPGLTLWGGETTVVLKGDGRGGRNQELALRVAQALAGRDFLFLSGGTDGRDGPTDAAGGIVDGGTWARVGPDAQALLENNDAYTALSRAGDLLQIPATGTNVADLQILWLAP